MPQIAIVNQSTIVTDVDGNMITGALNKVLPQFCRDWSIVSTTCVYVRKGSATNVPIKIFLLDSADVSGILGYHSLSNDIPCGKAFAKTILDSGGVLLYSSDPSVPTFAQIVCHEVFEILINPHCNVWAMLSDGETQYAYEVSDPVQSNVVTVNVEGGSATKGKFFARRTFPIYTKVGVSDWVLPSWFNTQATKGPFNHTKTLNGPFTVDKHGYVISLDKNSRKLVWGASLTVDRKEEITKKMILKKRIT